MQETPPRRRRPPPRDDGPSLPFIPIVLGVIVLGFVIGAGLSVAGRHGSAPSDLPVAAATPHVEATVASATIAPATLAPAATVAPSAKPTPKPTVTSRAATPEPNVSPSAAATPSVAPSAASPTPTDTPHIAPAAPRAIVAAPPPPPSPRSTASSAPAAPAAPPTTQATPVPQTSDDTTSEFGKLAAGVVRSFLAAIARGDTDGAYAQLGATPGEAGVTLPEVGIVTRATRIEHVEARGGDSAVTVNVDMLTPNGAYFGQYTVHRTANGAAAIVAHAIFKS